MLLIFFGAGYSDQRRERIGVTCPNCRNQGMNLTVSSRYMQFFFAPTIPLGGHAELTCPHCHFTYPDETLSDQSWVHSQKEQELYRKIQELKGVQPIRWWHFTGLILVGLFILLWWTTRN